MKLFIVAVLISAVSAARLEHLERGYLPPDQNSYSANAGGSSFPSAGAHGNFGLSQGSQYNSPSRASNGFGGFGHSNGFGNNGAGSNGFRANSGHGSNGFGSNGGRGSTGFGSSNYGANGVGSGRIGGSSAATSNQYLPPNYGSAGSNGDGSFGSSIKPACSTCGSSSTFGSPQRYQQQTNTFGSQGLSIPSTQYGSPQSSIPSSNFGSQSSFTSQQNVPAGANRQYLAPKSSSFQNTPQQPFDENTGYIY